jgi:glycosyltransferase involved in cell wall biosynthesis
VVPVPDGVPVPEVDLGRVAVVIPARDEAEALPPLLQRLRDEGAEWITVVDNGSSDGTGDRARSAGARVVAEPRMGYGRACLAGIALLRREAGAGLAPVPDVVLFMDGDGSDDPRHLPLLLEPVLTGEAEMTVGVRTGEGEGAQSPGSAEPGELRARFGTGLILALARRLHGLEARDLGPFRAIRWELLEALGMDDPTWGWTLQMQLRAHHLGATVRQVEVPRGRRQAGRSKVSGSLGVSLRVGIRMGWTLLREGVLRRRRERSGRRPAPDPARDRGRP